jgi:hypothetical protein
MYTYERGRHADRGVGGRWGKLTHYKFIHARLDPKHTLKSSIELS